MPDPLTWMILIGTALLGSTIGGIAGFGAGILLLPVAAWTLGTRAAVPVLTVTMLLGNLARIWWSRGELHGGLTLRFIAGAVPTTALGVMIFAGASSEWLARAIGAFLLLSSDYRIGTAGPYRIVANEVAIGITMPHFAVEVCRHRLAPAHFSRAVINAESYDPEQAIAAGWLDRVVPVAELQDAARAKVVELLKLNAAAHAATKLRARATALQSVHTAIANDRTEFKKIFGL